MATQRQKQRKTGELARLEQRLSSGTKRKRIENKQRNKGYSTTQEFVPMNETDKKILSGTIENLKKALGLQHVTA